MLRGIPPAVPRGAQIDFRTAGESMITLEKIYARDIDAKEMSDEGVGAVNTSVRALEGAMGKVAHAVYKHHCTRKARTYFPLTDNPADFPALLESNLPDIATNNPGIADAFERHQPYQKGGKEVLALLKPLYRQNHHHDFTVQERLQKASIDWTISPGMEMSIGEDSISIGRPRWKGVPVERTGSAGLGMALHESRWLDWYFVAPHVSVLGTLISLYNRSAEACNDVSQTAGL